MAAKLRRARPYATWPPSFAPVAHSPPRAGPRLVASCPSHLEHCGRKLLGLLHCEARRRHRGAAAPHAARHRAARVLSGRRGGFGFAAGPVGSAPPGSRLMEAQGRAARAQLHSAAAAALCPRLGCTRRWPFPHMRNAGLPSSTPSLPPSNRNAPASAARTCRPRPQRARCASPPPPSLWPPRQSARPAARQAPPWQPPGPPGPGPGARDDSCYVTAGNRIRRAVNETFGDLDWFHTGYRT
jgi:hypothetical protein